MKKMLIIFFLLFSFFVHSKTFRYGPNQHIQTYEEAIDTAKTGDNIIFVEADTLSLKPGWHWICLPNITETFMEWTHADDLTKPFMGEIYGEMIGMQDGMKEFCQFSEILGYFPSNLLIYPWSGLKIRVYDEYSRRHKSIMKIPLNGKMLPQNFQIPLTPGKYNWIGYHLPQTQNVEMAFGHLWEKVRMVKAQDWCYFRPDEYFDDSISAALYSRKVKFWNSEKCMKCGSMWMWKEWCGMMLIR